MTMPPAEDIQRQMTGAWMMMTGRRDGIRQLDLSMDGFWNSFFAIVVAAPVMLAGWAPMAGEIAGADTGFGHRASIVARLALVDIGAWILPIVGLAAIAGAAGIRDRFVHYVVATNWGGALFSWFMLPVAVMRLFAPGLEDVTTALSLGIFLACLVLLWRLTDAAVDKGAGVATAVFSGMLIASILTLFALQDLLGIAVPQ